LVGVIDRQHAINGQSSNEAADRSAQCATPGLVFIAPQQADGCADTGSGQKPGKGTCERYEAVEQLSNPATEHGNDGKKGCSRQQIARPAAAQGGVVVPGQDAQREHSAFQAKHQPLAQQKIEKTRAATETKVEKRSQHNTGKLKACQSAHA